jgi:uncharacterized protein
MTYLQIKVIPKSPKTEFIEKMADDTLKIRIAAPPEKGKANAELIKFLAKEFSCPKGQIKIISGQTDQRKLVRIPDNVDKTPFPS